MFFATQKKNKDFAHQIKDIFTTRWTFCLKAGQKLKRQNVKTYYERQATWESAQSQNPWSNVALWFKSVFLRWFWKSVWLNYDIWIQHPGNAMLLFLTIYYITNQPRTFQKEIHHPVCVDHFLWHLSNKKKNKSLQSVVICKKIFGDNFPPVLHDFQRCIEGVRSARHGHFKAMPHFCKPGHSGNSGSLRLTVRRSPFEEGWFWWGVEEQSWASWAGGKTNPVGGFNPSGKIWVKMGIFPR